RAMSLSQALNQFAQNLGRYLAMSVVYALLE
ncbi:integrase, partial [Bifidobacterium longum]